MAAPFTELFKPLEEFAMRCRGCLAESGEMKNILEWNLADVFNEFTDIRLVPSESISQLLCVDCEQALMACKHFKAQCQASELVLRNMAVDSKTMSQDTAEKQYTTQNTITNDLQHNRLVTSITAPNTEEKIYLKCPFCETSFIKQKDILIHARKKHNLDEQFTLKVDYYCHVPTCSYYIERKTKSFSSRKLLNQHVVKVHTEKKIQCDMCFNKFSTANELNRHKHMCNMIFGCEACNVTYNTHEKLLVHLLRKHPDLHREYKQKRKVMNASNAVKKPKLDDYFTCHSPTRSFATQTLQDHIKKDVSLPQWNNNVQWSKRDEISTQTVDDLFSLKSQTSDEELYFSEPVSLSDIQTQTFEFGMGRSNKETLTDWPDLSIKETQTCVCMCESPKLDGTSCLSANLTSTETQTAECRNTVKTDVLLSFHSTQTQTNFDENLCSKSDNL